MRRLTVKNGEGLIVEHSFDYSLQNKVCYEDCIHKLGQLEDILDEFNIINIQDLRSRLKLANEYNKSWSLTKEDVWRNR